MDEWDEYNGSNKVAKIALLLQESGFFTDVCETSLEGHAKGTYLLRYWPQDDDGSRTYVLMGDLGITWEPPNASPTEELGRITLDMGPEDVRAALRAVVTDDAG